MTITELIEKHAKGETSFHRKIARERLKQFAIDLLDVIGKSGDAYTIQAWRNKAIVKAIDKALEEMS